MFISNLYISRPSAPDDKKNKKVGKIWYDTTHNRASILLTGIPLGVIKLAGIPFDNVSEAGEPPYIQGDILCKVGRYEKDGEIKNEWQWCGHIQSTQRPDGKTIYWGTIEVMPVVQVRDGKSGVFLSVFEESAPKQVQQATPNYDGDVATGGDSDGIDDDKLPF